MLDGLAAPGGNACTSAGLVVVPSATAAPTAGVGLFRNNVVLAGVCATHYGVIEAGDAADPRVFESNDLDPTGAPTALYLDSPTNPLATAAAVDGLTDMTVSGTLSADPLFVTYPTDLHVMSGSPCDGAGTAAGAPPVDMDGDARDATTPDVGADEI